jgi:hypothetical protein
MRFCGIVGYADTDVETAPGVWAEQIVAREYRGDVIRSARQLESTTTLNDSVTLENSFSIVADGFAYENFSKMRYVSWNGYNWTITNVEVRRPRLILTIGDIWNGETAN